MGSTSCAARLVCLATALLFHVADGKAVASQAAAKIAPQVKDLDASTADSHGGAKPELDAVFAASSMMLLLCFCALRCNRVAEEPSRPANAAPSDSGTRAVLAAVGGVAGDRRLCTLCHFRFTLTNANLAQHNCPQCRPRIRRPVPVNAPPGAGGSTAEEAAASTAAGGGLAAGAASGGGSALPEPLAHGPPLDPLATTDATLAPTAAQRHAAVV
jgi:hypothetical protein